MCVRFMCLAFFASNARQIVTNPYGHTQYHNQVKCNHIHMHRHKHAQATNFTEPNNIQSIYRHTLHPYTQTPIRIISILQYVSITRCLGLRGRLFMYIGCNECG